jgi:transcriptional antiterminator Rof (Rho-off)
MTADYQPISCALHDRLEAAAVRRRPVDLRVRTPEGRERELRGVIEDVFAENGEEFVRLRGTEPVRLDRILAFDGTVWSPS